MCDQGVMNVGLLLGLVHRHVAEMHASCTDGVFTARSHDGYMSHSGVVRKVWGWEGSCGASAGLMNKLRRTTTEVAQWLNAAM